MTVVDFISQSTSEQSEKWLDVLGYEGLYQVSDRGQVRTVDRTDTLNRRVHSRILIQSVNKRLGRLQVSLTKDRKEKSWRVHNLVALAFFGKPQDGFEVNHINGNKLDNALSNLEYLTRKQNMQHAVDNGLTPHKGQTHPMAKLTNDDVLQIKQLSNSGVTGRELSRLYNVCTAQISRIINGKEWGHL